MLKLSHPDYFLPIVEAMEAGIVLSSGRTRPMIIRGNCIQTNVVGEYVVKLKGSDQMWDGSSINELLASFLAMELDLSVPQPALITVSHEFTETMRQRHTNFSIASNSIGLNFGSALVDGYQVVIAGQSLNSSLFDKLAEMFAFDIFIGNPDRRIDKPNFLSNGKNVLLFDHEMAFPFAQILPFARNNTPWMIPAADMTWLSNNYCYKALKGNSFDFTKFTGRLSVISEEFWARVTALMPTEWGTGHLSVIKGYLNSIIEHRDLFAAELNRILL